MTRQMQPLAHLFSHAADVAPERIASVEGVKEHGDLTVKVLQVGAEILMLEVTRKAGQIDPPHKHDDHESCGYMIQGRMKVVVGDKEFIAGPGSSWKHPPGVVHSAVALTDCKQIEIKSPPMRTWKSE